MPLPAADPIHRHVEQPTQHRRRVIPLNLVPALIETDQLQPLRFTENAYRLPLFFQELNLDQFSGRLTVDFQGPAFFADDQHGCQPADVVCGRAAVLFRQLRGLAVSHRGQSPRKSHMFALQAR